MQHEQIHILPPKSTYHTKQKETKTFNTTTLHKKQLKHFQKTPLTLTRHRAINSNLKIQNGFKMFDLRKHISVFCNMFFNLLRCCC